MVLWRGQTCTQCVRPDRALGLLCARPLRALRNPGPCPVRALCALCPLSWSWLWLRLWLVQMEQGVHGIGLRGDLDLALGADLKAHRPPGVEHDGAPDDTASRPAMPYEMHVQGERSGHARGIHSVRPGLAWCMHGALSGRMHRECTGHAQGM